MGTVVVSSAEINALRKEIDALSPDEIRALQAFGIQQAGRNGLVRDARLIVIFAILAGIFGLVSPVYPALKTIHSLSAIFLIAGATKAIFRPTLNDMMLIVILLMISVVMNAVTGVANVLLFNQPILAIFLIALAGIEGRWAMNLWQSYRVAKQSDNDLADFPRISELYQIAVQILLHAQPQPDNTLVYFRAGQEALRLLPGHRYGLSLSRNGMVQLVSPQMMTMQVNPQQDRNALNYEVALTIKKRVLHGEVSSISYDNFQQWQQHKQ